MRTDPTLLDGLALLAATADELVVATVRDTHLAIADRLTTPLRTGPRTPGISDFVYAIVGGSLKVASSGLNAVASTGVGPALEGRGAGRFLSAAVNGLIGDELAERRPAMAITMALRQRGADVRPTINGLRDAYPNATGKVVVFLHGLCEDENAWRLHRTGHGSTYAAALKEHGWTPLFLRSNSGLSLAANSAAFSDLMTRISDRWPVPLERIALVGHSQGGLIMRTALAAAEPGEWISQVSDLVTLGTPHHGSHIARAATRGSRTLSRLPETTGFSRWILERRSAGIRDLDFGLADDLAIPSQVRVHMVGASLGRHPDGWVSTGFGDLLVQPRSATGSARGRTPLAFHSTAHLARTHHFTLLNHAGIREALVEWLSAPALKTPALAR